MESLWTGERIRLRAVRRWATEADPAAGRFGYGIAIGRPYQRRGYASEAVVILLRYLFGERRYHKCEVGIYAYNEPSVALHRRLGFVEEGRRHAGIVRCRARWG